MKKWYLAQFDADNKLYLKKLSEAEAKTVEASGKISRANGNIGGSFKSIASGLASVVGGFSIFSLLTKSIEEAVQSSVSLAKVKTAVETTGKAAGFSSEELVKMASGLQDIAAVDNDTILTNITNNLLTFKNVAGDVFKRAQTAILDLNAVISNGDVGALTSQTIQLGKALNDPITGINSLTRVGVSFSDEQKKQIKLLVEQNRLFEAQSIILNEIEGQYGGQAEVLALNDGGFKKLKQSVADVEEGIGKDLVKVLTEGTASAGSFADEFIRLNEAMKELNGGIGIVGTAINSFGDILTGGKLTLDQFLVNPLIEEFKKNFIKNLEEAKKKTKEFYDALGLNKPQQKVLPITPALDTKAGDDILEKLEEQNTKIAQIRNKLLDQNLTVKQRIALEKELNDILDKQKTKGLSKEEIAAQVAAGRSPKFEEYLKNLSGAEDMNSINLRSGSLLEPKQKEYLFGNQDYNQVKYTKQENPKFGMNEVKVPELQNPLENYSVQLQKDLEDIKKAEQEYLDWRFEAWKQSFGNAKIVLDSSIAGMESAYDTFWQTLGNEDMSGAERIRAMWDSLKSTALQTFGDILKGYISNALKSAVVGEATKAAQVAEGVALGSALTAAYTPAATLASIMSFGGASIAGLAALQTALASSSALNGVLKMASGGSFDVPAGFPNDSFPLLVESGERVSVSSKNQTSYQDKTLSTIARKLDILNANFLDKNFAPNINVGLELDGRKVSKSVIKNINNMQKEGRDFSLI